jgi:uncharacterized repeat protein (TIGR01451 family)
MKKQYNKVFFFNNCRFLSLFPAKRGCIFVLHSAVKQLELALMKLRPANKMTLLHSFVVALILLVTTAGGLKAQGWQFNFGGSKEDEGWAVLQTEDEGFIVVGFGESFGTDNDQNIFVVRTDIDGTVLWTKYYDEGFQEQARAIIPTADGNYLIVGNIVGKPGERENIYLLKIDRKGGLLWTKQFGGAGNERANDVVLNPDGGFSVVGTSKAATEEDENILLVRFNALGEALWSKTYGTARKDEGKGISRIGDGFALLGNSRSETGFDNNIALYRVDNAGNIIWERRIANSFREEGRAILTTQDGGLAIAGVINDNSDALIVKYDANGNQRWLRSIGNDKVEEEANAITELKDGSLVITGLKLVSSANVDLLVAKLDAKGNILWEKAIGDAEFTEEGRDIQATKAGGYIITGYNGQLLNTFNDLILVKTDGAGNTITNRLNGRIFVDRDNQCDYDNGEAPLSGWIVKATKGIDVIYGTSDKNGYYSILVDTGAYKLSVLPPNRYWSTCNPEGVNVRLRNFYDSLQVDFGAKTAVNCPYMEVDITTPFLATCSDVEYVVNYCNTGTANAQGAYVDLTLDSKLAFKSATVSAEQLPNGKLRFRLGTVPVNGCGFFTVRTGLDCNGIAQGQSGLVAARVFPDTFCLDLDPRWDRSSIIVRGACKKDTVIFEIQNIGKGDMKERKKGIVIQDDIIMRNVTPTYQLQSGKSIEVRIPNPDGSTLRLFAEQSTGHPGRSLPTVAVEGCAETGKPIKTGQVTQFPEDDQDAFVSVDVQEIFSAVQPVALRGHPKGYGKQSTIDAKTDLTFTVLFQNSGSDTVQRVVIRDTLSQAIDPTTVIPGASSHPYSFEVYDGGILKITFDGIKLLPANGGTAQKTYGYVEFRASQKPNNPKGTVIDNRATVYFDYRLPSGTNTIRWTVDQFPDFVKVITSSQEVFVPGVKVDIYPNPFSEMVTLEVKGRQYDRLTLKVYDLNGKIVQQKFFNSNFCYVYRDQLAAGIYAYRLESEGQLINTGKLIVR